MTRPVRSIGPQHVVTALTMLLTAAAAVLAWRSATGPVLDLRVPAPVLAGSLVVLFFLGEQLLINIEFRRQAHSMTLAGVPLALAVLLAPAHTLVLMRVAGAMAALLLQRISLDKLLYNTAAYAFELAADSTVARLLLGAHPHLDAGNFSLLLLTVVLVDQLMSALVLLIIRIHAGPLSWADVIEVSAPALALSLACTAFAAIIAALLVNVGLLGLELVLIVGAVATLAYRGYATTTRRHQSLQLVHDFVADGVGLDSVQALAAHLLTQVREVMNAGTAQLDMLQPALPPTHEEQDPTGTARILTRASVDERGQLSVTDDLHADPDVFVRRAYDTVAPVLLARSSKDSRERNWLARQGVRDAVLVPVTVSGDTVGVLTVLDRLGETSGFTPDDVALLQTLAGHLGIALRSTRLVEKLSHDASHDALTGLHNRAHLAGALARLSVVSSAAVLLLDLNGFKEVNDTLGHDAGDRLLKVIAGRLKERVPDRSTVARLGGDEFAILLPACEALTAQAFAESVSDVIRQPIQLEEARLDVYASIGVAVSDTSADHSDLLRQADTAMYAAKTSGRPVATFDPDMDRERLHRSELLGEMRTALREDPSQFVVYYQPKVHLLTSVVVSVEALVRWQHPRLGFIAPDEFVPIAEASGLITELTFRVLDAALADCARWVADGHDISVAVNLSARNIEDAQLPHRVAAALDQHALPASKLILEITESSVMGDPEQTLPILHALRRLGLALSLDDFGTGYSSLSYLQRLPVDEVKIDRSFVVGLDNQDAANSRALIQSITNLGRSLQLRIVAEGVEDSLRMSELRDLGCDLAQGYHISRPLPAHDLRLWLRTQQAQNHILTPALPHPRHSVAIARSR